MEDEVKNPPAEASVDYTRLREVYKKYEDKLRFVRERIERVHQEDLDAKYDDREGSES